MHLLDKSRSKQIWTPTLQKINGRIYLDANSPEIEAKANLGANPPEIEAMDEADLISFIQNERDPMATKIRWDPTFKTGVVFHLFKFIKPYGRVGFTAIGASSDHAHILYDDTVKLLKQISKKRTKC